MKATSDRSKTAVADPAAAIDVALKPDPPRGTIAEWAITILLLLFGTTTLVQAASVRIDFDHSAKTSARLPS